jgi:tetratricopeptide (TPR) repeat protein
MCRARVHHRRGEAESSIARGTEAARKAGELGDSAYETRVGALLMVASDCANLNRLDEAERCFEDAIRLAEAHGDLLHLAGTHINRVLLWFARKDAQRIFEDFERTIVIAREIGQPQLEYYALWGLGEVAYVLEDLDRATRDTLRAVDIVRQIWGESSRELSARELLLARIALYRCDFATAGTLALRIRERLAQARAAGVAESELVPSDAVLLEMVELSVRGASREAWDEYTARTSTIECQPLEELERVEARALTAYRYGRVEESRRQFERADELSAAKPNLLSDRVSRRRAELFP